MQIDILGAFVHGALFIAGLFVYGLMTGNHFAVMAALAAAGCAYASQACSAYTAQGVRGMWVPGLVTMAASAVSALAGAVSLL